MTATVVLGMVSLSLAVLPAKAEVQDPLRQDADFVRSLQLRDGAIVSDTSRRLIEPYVANYAAWGLARAARHTGDRSYFRAALGWLRWYQDHMGPDAIVHDYTVVKGRPQVTDDEDSVDATSGTFLLALRELYLAAPKGSGRSYVEHFHAAMAGAVGAIESLRDVDGLTWAKPTWPVKYLMDNAEAYGGLIAAAELARVVGDEALATAALEGAARAREGVSTLWNPDTEAFDWAEHGDGFRQPTQWDMLYPDAVEQMWAVAYELVDSPRAGTMVARFGETQPDWDRPTAMATYWDGVPYSHPVAFWPVAGWAGAVTGDSSRAASAAANIRNGALEMNRRPPFTSGSQGQLIILATGGLPLG